MAIRVAINHKTEYQYDRLVSLSPHIVRLRPAAHTRTPIHSYSLKISPEEQAGLVRTLVTGQLPFSKNAQMALKEIMMIVKTSRGIFYGKTGTGSDIEGDPKQNIGWYVGYVESGSKTYSFACIVRGENLKGNDAKKIVETILKQNGLL